MLPFWGDDPFYDDIQIMRNLAPPSGYKVNVKNEMVILIRWAKAQKK